MSEEPKKESQSMEGRRASAKIAREAFEAVLTILTPRSL